MKVLNLLSILDLEMAVAYWNLVLTGRFKFLDLWNRFLLVSVEIFVLSLVIICSLTVNVVCTCVSKIFEVCK